MRYLVLLTSFLVLALLELPAQAASPTDSVVSSLDDACQSTCLGLTAELPTRADVVSQPYAYVDVMPKTLACGSAPEVLRLLCFSDSSTAETNYIAGRTGTIANFVRVIGDRRTPLTC